MQVERSRSRNGYETEAEFSEAFNKYRSELLNATNWNAEELHAAGPERALGRIIELGHVIVDAEDIIVSNKP